MLKQIKTVVGSECVAEYTLAYIAGFTIAGGVYTTLREFYHVPEPAAMTIGIASVFLVSRCIKTMSR